MLESEGGEVSERILMWVADVGRLARVLREGPQEKAGWDVDCAKRARRRRGKCRDDAAAPVLDLLAAARLVTAENVGVRCLIESVTSARVIAIRALLEHGT